MYDIYTYLLLHMHSLIQVYIIMNLHAKNKSIKVTNAYSLWCWWRGSSLHNYLSYFKRERIIMKFQWYISTLYCYTLYNMTIVVNLWEILSPVPRESLTCYVMSCDYGGDDDHLALHYLSLSLNDLPTSVIIVNRQQNRMKN